MVTGFAAILGEMQFAQTRIITGSIFTTSTENCIQSRKLKLRSRINTGSVCIEIVEYFGYNLKKL